MNAARLSSVTAWTVVQLRDAGQMHTSTGDCRYTRAAPEAIRPHSHVGLSVLRPKM
jgi:hypothetical protein